MISEIKKDFEEIIYESDFRIKFSFCCVAHFTSGIKVWQAIRTNPIKLLRTE